MASPLSQYQNKRDFKRTKEPAGKIHRLSKQRFVIQKHAASRLHYDLRLEMEGVLKSWAVPKGLPFEAGGKHLAVEVEDHPVSYFDFEGTIPKGQYGGGTVVVWDHGQYVPEGDPAVQLQKGNLVVELQGTKLKGSWHLVRMKDDKQWLVIRGTPGMKAITAKVDDTSALTHRTMEQIAAGKASPKTITQKKRGKKNNAAPKLTTKNKTPSATRDTETANQKFPEFLDPMKAQLVSHLPEKDWLYEVKLDGYRALAFINEGKVRLLSRNQISFAEKFPDIMQSLESLNVGNAILDGEIVALDSKGHASFQALQNHARNKAAAKNEQSLQYHLFDLLWLEHHDLRKQTIEDRKMLLAQLMKSSEADNLHVCDHSDDAPEKMIRQASKHKLEGIIAKRKGSAYETGKRSGTWIKFKLQQEQEFVIGGYTPPTGSRSHFGSLVVGVYEKKQLIYTGKVGTGFNEKTLESLHKKLEKLAVTRCPFDNLDEVAASKNLSKKQIKAIQWVKPQLVAQIKFANWTHDELLRQPVFLGLRIDKDPQDVIHEKPVNYE